MIRRYLIRGYVRGSVQKAGGVAKGFDGGGV